MKLAEIQPNNISKYLLPQDNSVLLDYQIRPLLRISEPVFSFWSQDTCTIYAMCNRCSFPRIAHKESSDVREIGPQPEDPTYPFFYLTNIRTINHMCSENSYVITNYFQGGKLFEVPPSRFIYFCSRALADMTALHLKNEMPKILNFVSQRVDNFPISHDEPQEFDSPVTLLLNSNKQSFIVGPKTMTVVNEGRQSNKFFLLCTAASCFAESTMEGSIKIEISLKTINPDPCRILVFYILQEYGINCYNVNLFDEIKRYIYKGTTYTYKKNIKVYFMHNMTSILNDPNIEGMFLGLTPINEEENKWRRESKLMKNKIKSAISSNNSIYIDDINPNKVDNVLDHSLPPLHLPPEVLLHILEFVKASEKIEEEKNKRRIFKYQNKREEQIK